MGIPKYFNWIIKHLDYEQFISRGEMVDHLYLDFNCAIHPAAKSEPEAPDDVMYGNIIRYLEYLIDTVQPRQLVYIAIDGVAPLAKMKQQRARRYKTVRETADLQKIRDKYGEKKASVSRDRDFNMISPATQFMSELSGYINRFITSIIYFQ